MELLFISTDIIAIFFIIGIESNWSLEDFLEVPIWALLFFVSSILFLFIKKHNLKVKNDA